MRTFRIYAPILIANHVCAFFKGQFEIEHKGTFKFDGGKIIIDEHLNDAERRIAKEVNKTIAGFLARSRHCASGY